MRKIFLLTCSLVLMNSLLHAQFFSKIQLKHYFNLARRAISFNNYTEAIPHLEFLLKKDSLNANFNYLLGLCYYHIPLKKNKALPYLMLASKNVSTEYSGMLFKEKNAPIKTFYYIADIYHYTYNFDKADNFYRKYMEYLSPNSPEYKEAVRMIEVCRSATSLINDSIEISIENLGPTVNSKYDEHSPTLTSDESTLILTSRKKESTGGLLTDDGKFFEDI